MPSMWFILTVFVFYSMGFNMNGYNNLVSSFHEITPILILAFLAMLNSMEMIK